MIKKKRDWTDIGNKRKKKSRGKEIKEDGKGSGKYGKGKKRKERA